jgi:hypothetical protein
MTAFEAKKILETGMYTWFDFDWWACLQLYARGLDGEEYVQKFELVQQLHKKREVELKAFRENMKNRVEKMSQDGTPIGEINDFISSHSEELQKRVKAWRSLD